MLSGSIKKYPEARQQTHYSGYNTNYDDFGDYYSGQITLADRYKELQAAKNTAIKNGFDYNVRVKVINSEQTGTVKEFAMTLKDGLDALDEYMPIGVLVDNIPSKNVIFYSEKELEIIK